MTAPVAPAKHPRSRRHTMATMTTARTMYAGGEGWTPTQIVRYFEAHGVLVSQQKVREWVIPGLAEERLRQRAARRAFLRQMELAGTTERPAVVRETDDDKIVRVGLALRERGVSYFAIAHALGVCEGIERDANTVRRILRAAGAVPDHRRGRTFKAA